MFFLRRQSKIKPRTFPLIMWSAYRVNATKSLDIFAARVLYFLLNWQLTRKNQLWKWDRLWASFNLNNRIFSYFSRGLRKIRVLVTVTERFARYTVFPLSADNIATRKQKNQPSSDKPDNKPLIYASAISWPICERHTVGYRIKLN